MNDEQRELISAFYDDQLDEIQTESAKRLLNQDPAARVYLEEIRRLDQVLGRAFEPVMREPMPQGLVAVVGECGKDHRPEPGFGSRLPAQIAQPLNYTWAITLALLAVPLLRQPLSGRMLVGIGVSYCGVLILLTQGSLHGLEQVDWLGVALALLGSLFLVLRGESGLAGVVRSPLETALLAGWEHGNNTWKLLYA